jgi:hypothetical protein
MARVAARKRSERVDSIHNDPEPDRAVAARIDARPGLYVPLVVADRALGGRCVRNDGAASVGPS